MGRHCMGNIQPSRSRKAEQSVPTEGMDQPAAVPGRDLEQGRLSTSGPSSHDLTAEPRRELENCACDINRISKAIGHKLIELGEPATRAHEILAKQRDGAFE